ncbi:glycosyltransferase family 61 protein [Candidatus Dependentiae bacterium]|nr:glycosyltransferase family 61 protein [Candidatus Dependentiae bacterium]
MNFLRKYKKKFIYLILYLSFNTISPFKITSLKTILKEHPEIIYQPVCDELPFKIAPFQIAPSFPHKGTFEKLFILTIPNGLVRGMHGHVIIHDTFIEELIWGGLINSFQIPFNTQNIDPETVLKVPGKVAVISQLDSKNYCHWLLEILGRLAILEMNHIEYDWLYVSIEEQPFVKKIAELWGIDISKVISPHDHYFTIEAETLIVPSLVIHTDQGHRQFGNFYHPITTEYTKNKLLTIALEKNINSNQFCKKVFISRGDNINARKILNENEIFDLFQALGFKRYELSNLSIEEQIILFNNAEIIIGEHGAGMTNLLFCKPNTKVIEIFHNFVPMDFWYIASFAKLNYTPINTLLDQEANIFANWHSHKEKIYSLPIRNIIPLDKIKKLIEKL